MILVGFGNGIGAGGNSLISRYIGAEDRHSANNAAIHNLILSVIISIIISIVFIFSMKSLLIMMGAESVIDYATEYGFIIFAWTFALLMPPIVGGAFRAEGDIKRATIPIALAAIINMILDPIFIFGFNLGVKGAAYATIISQALSCVWVITFLSGKKTLLKLRFKNMRINAKLILPCLALGLSTFIMQSSESVISVCFNSSLLKYGGDLAVGAMTILTSVMQFAILPMQGVAQGAQPILSYNFGAKNSARVKGTFKLLLCSCLIYSFAIWGAIMLFPRVFAGIFTPNAELLTFTAKALRIYCAVLCIFGIQIACQMTFVSIGSAVCSITVAIVRKFVLLLPFIYLIPLFVQNKTMGVYLAEPCADILAVSFTAILFAFQFKKAMKKLKSAD
jgi:putative MATE family efflux protein